METNPRTQLMDARDDLANAIAGAYALDCAVGVTAARELLGRIVDKLDRKGMGGTAYVNSLFGGDVVEMIRDAEFTVERLVFFCGGYARMRQASLDSAAQTAFDFEALAKVDAPAAKQMLADERRAAA